MKLRKTMMVFLSKSGTRLFANALYRKYLKMKNIINGSDGPDYVGWKSISSKQTIFVDISNLVEADHGGGIQRVQRSLIENWSVYPPEEFNVSPIFYSKSENKFLFVKPDQVPTLQLRQQSQTKIVQMTRGDIYLNTDLNYRFAIENEDFYFSLQKQKVSAYTLVYDLLPLTIPNSFPAGIRENHQQWLEVAMQNTRLICISKTVQSEAMKWGAIHGLVVQSASINLGSDISRLLSPRRVTEKKVTEGSQMNFLIVSTIEVRKCHELVLSAFEILWEQGFDVTLTFVGRKGWEVDSFLERLESHVYLNKKLFWFKNANDEQLINIYQNSTAVINASVGEGFGLPLVEASFFGLPLILRDIPIFREIAGDKSWFFSTKEDRELAISLMAWIEEYSRGNISSNTDIKIISWRESCNQILEIFKSYKFEKGKIS